MKYFLLFHILFLTIVVIGILIYQLNMYKKLYERRKKECLSMYKEIIDLEKELMVCKDNEHGTD